MNHFLRVGLLLLCFCPLFIYSQDVLSTLNSMYTTVKGDTWESVAADHGISINELREANPDVTGKKLKKGKLLFIPKASSVQRGDMAGIPLANVTGESSVIRTTIPNLKVGVLLPFEDAMMVEFYRGFLMAADSVRLSGVNLDIYAWDCGYSVSLVEDLQSKLNGMDIVFGPATPTQIPSVAAHCRELGIRHVLPFQNDLLLQEFPLVYSATASSPVLYDAAVKDLLDNYTKKNFVIVRSGTADSGNLLCSSIKQQLAQLNVIPRELKLEGDDFAYESAFNQFRNNVILLDDSSIRSLDALLARLKGFSQNHPDYHLSLVGFPEWQKESQRLMNDFFAFDTYIISPYYYNVLDSRTKHFQSSYEKNFHIPIAEDNPCYAALGFDLGYYFLQGISTLGETFEQMHGSLQQEPYQNRFRFGRNDLGMGFTNNFVQFIHYTREHMVELIR